MSNQPIEEYRMPGRPPKDPVDKVSTPIRCLTTLNVKKMVWMHAKELGISPSDMLRLTIYRYFDGKGLIDAEMQNDATWDYLKGAGLV